MGLNSNGQICVRFGTSAEKQQNDSFKKNKYLILCTENATLITAVGFIFSVESLVPVRPLGQTGRRAVLWPPSVAPGAQQASEPATRLLRSWGWASGLWAAEGIGGNWCSQAAGNS